MKYFILVLLLISTTLAGDSSNQFRVPHCSPIVRNLPIFQMTAYAKTGRAELRSTVVLVGPNTWATSAHGIRYGEVKEIIIHLPKVRDIKAKVTWYDRDKDIAVLYGHSNNIRPIDSMSYDLAQHEQVWNIGYPGFGAGLIMSYTGFQVRYKKDGLLITSAIGFQGMSGGATVRCVDGRLELVGIITALINHRVEVKIYTKKGVIHTDKTVTNNGITIISPMKFQK